MVIQHGRIDFPFWWLDNIIKIVAKMKILNPKSWWMEDYFLDFNWVNFMFHLNFQWCFPNVAFFMVNTRLPFVPGSKVAKSWEKVIQPFLGILTHNIHVWYIYLHLPYLPLKTAKCR